MTETRHLVVCCDGTWNSADQRTAGVPCPTNVRLIYNALQPTENQLVQYFSGVGTEGGRLRRVISGGIGLGLSRNIMNAYLWLAETFQPGDRIVLFGFSRGAYTVRSLVGMLTRCGLVSFPDGTPMRERIQVVQRIYNRGYRKRKKVKPKGKVTFHFKPEDAPIAFLGVWETVGALGVPRSFGLLGLLFQRKRYQFHDVDIHRDVAHARQALALDERRGPFVPALWHVQEHMRDRVKQLWFPGVHSDVGGGYLQTGLSHETLAWMVDEVKRVRVPLQWQPRALAGIEGNPFDVLHDNCTGIYRYLAPRPRNTPPVVAGNPEVHISAVKRSDNPPLNDTPYRQTTIVPPNSSHTVPVYAHLPWNATGLYLKPGEYCFSATGEWLDREIAAGPDGVRGLRARARGMIGYGLGTVAGVIRSAIQALTNNRAADVPGSKRVLRARWMELVCVVVDDVIAEDGTVTNSGPIPHRRFRKIITVEKPGYLYAFANDAWTAYGNNRGSIQLTITRQR